MASKWREHYVCNVMGSEKCDGFLVMLIAMVFCDGFLRRLLATASRVRERLLACIQVGDGTYDEADVLVISPLP